MREMGPSFVTVAAQGFYRSRVRNCYPLPHNPLEPQGFEGFFLAFKRRLALFLALLLAKKFSQPRRFE